jgi:predicted PurR-regulated permease PerM
VTVGASMMGIVGMLIFIPLCSVLYTLLRSIVNLRLQGKGAEASE